MTFSPQTVTVGQLLKEGGERLDLRISAGDCPEALNREIPEPLAHRPGLALCGFFEHFAEKRIQVVGLAEYSYLQSLPESTRRERIGKLFSHGIPCLVFCRGQEIFPEALELGEKTRTAVLSTAMETRHFIHASTFVFENILVPRTAVYATMLEVGGLGVLMEGEAGIGKSETALGLIKRGHALVADDYTVVKRNGDNELIASASERTRGFMEIRGVGIINVEKVFGIAAVRGEKRLDMVISLVRSDKGGVELDRVGLDESRMEFLGISVPRIVIPVAPGRDMVNIVETAAQEHKLRRMTGYVAAKDLERRLTGQYPRPQ